MAKREKGAAYPLIFDTVCGGMEEPTGWIIDARGRYLAEGCAEDSQGQYIKNDRERNEALTKIVNAANILPALLEAAERVEAMMAEDWPCECATPGNENAIYEPGETCPPCALRKAIKEAR